MTTYEEYIPKEREINLKGNYAKELRGLWHVQGDFMGGPFVSYSMVDEHRNRVITIDGYVYAPKFDKREYLRQLHALALTVSFYFLSKSSPNPMTIITRNHFFVCNFVSK